MIRRLIAALGTRNLLVLGLVGSLALGGATVAFAEDRDEAINRREDSVQAEVDASDDDLDDGEDPTGNVRVDATGDRATGDASRASRDRDTNSTRDRDTRTGTGTGGGAAASPQDTGDPRSNDGTVGGDTTAAPRAQADDSNDGNSAGDDSGDGASASGDTDD